MFVTACWAIIIGGIAMFVVQAIVDIVEALDDMRDWKRMKR